MDTTKQAETEASATTAATTFPTADDIAHLTAKAVDDCERAANSLEDIAAAGDRLAAKLRAGCEAGAASFRAKGKEAATSFASFAQYIDGQCAVVKTLHDQADEVSPPHKPGSRVVMRNGAHD